MISVADFDYVDSMSDMGDRLRRARIAAGFDSAAKAAAALGVSASTYRAHENGQNDYNTDEAERYGKKFGVSAAYLLTGAPGQLSKVVPVMGYLGAGAEVEPDYEQVPDDGMEDIAVPFALPDDMIAFKVRGESMLPVYKPDHIIICYRQQRKPLDSFLGLEAAVRTSDGRRFIKTIMRGVGNTVNLISWNAAPIEGVRLEWIGEIFAAFPPSAVTRVLRQGGIQGQFRPPASA